MNTEFVNHRLDALREEIALKLCEIEDTCKDYGLPLSRLTCVARDPSNDKMMVCVTNEPDRVCLGRAFSVALSPDTQHTPAPEREQAI